MNALKGIALQIGATFLFTIMSAMVRMVSEHVPTGEVVFARSFFALFPLLAMLTWRGEISAAVRTAHPVGHIVRGTIGVVSMILSFSALARIPLADATAIGFTAPLLTVVLAALVLGERVQIYRWIAVLIGLCGVVVMLWPHLTGNFDTVEHKLGAIMALAAAGFTAGAMIQVRRLTGTETTAAIVFYFQALAAVAGLATAAWGWVVPSPREAIMLLAIGILGGIAQILLTESYRWAPASVVAPFTYSAMLWSLLLGFALFSEVPPLLVLLGAAIVIGAGLFVIWRERRSGIERRLEEAAITPPGPSA
ncbi:drug/metabolite transporter (DMT)-like permease [Angulomicrobium tetraedrale]|uniref:Drug/metabolite transporter (DMT)-like permease n=1 Tax=Ancylobacter tetraedralis TaxID=217068 RepID=A0A839ZDV8_9HYPH|nr:DMT family transporter [Ancylobacter tetraedralis]MBB3772835.1 drug/metabolite transporter (DMT)-like permease [Ancylobacter tetraedralis]